MILFFTILLVSFLTIIYWITSLRYPVAGAEGREINPPTSWREPADAFRVGTFNIHRSIGKDKVKDLQRVATAVAKADVVGIQEAEAPVISGGVNQVQRIGLMHDMGWLFIPTEYRWCRENRGNGLLSRFPVKYWYREPLPDTTGTHYRNFTTAEVAIGDKSVMVLVTHVSKRADQDAQLRRIIGRFLQYESAILLGDLNTAQENALLRELVETGQAEDAIASALGDGTPRRYIDWILVRGLNIKGGGYMEEGISDHPYFWVDLEFPDSQFSQCSESYPDQFLSSAG